MSGGDSTGGDNDENRGEGDNANNGEGRDLLGEFQRLDIRTLWGFWLFRLRQHTLRRQTDGSLYPAYILECNDWVNVVSTTQDGQLIMVRQLRFGTWTEELEVPGGILDRGEDPAQAAERELLEETGYRCGRLSRLGVVRPNPAVQNNRLHVFWAQDCRLVAEQRLDAFESIQVQLLPQERAYAMLGQDIGHAAAVSSLALFFRNQGVLGKGAPDGDALATDAPDEGALGKGGPDG